MENNTKQIEAQIKSAERVHNADTEKTGEWEKGWIQGYISALKWALKELNNEVLE